MTLVLLHPLGADRHVWAPVLDRLRAHHEVVALDLPGFGDTPAAADPSPPGLAAAVAQELVGRGIERPHVAGNSLGGWVALELALAGRARTVTAIAPAGLWPRALGPKPDVARRAAKALQPALPVLMRSDALRRLALAGTVARPERVPAAAAAALIRAYAAAPGFVEVNRAMRSARFERLADITVPVTLAWPQHDRLIARPRTLPPNTRSVAMPGCGHVPMWDDPQQVAEVILTGTRSAPAPALA